jgi:hypothetical protein
MQRRTRAQATRRAAAQRNALRRLYSIFISFRFSADAID